LKIQLDASRRADSRFQEIFRRDSLGTGFESLTPTRSGSYSISIISIGTSFESRRNNESEAFERFVENIGVIQNRLNTTNTGGGEYDQNSQDVLIPAFLSAYSGENANSINLRPFPTIPIPNWRVDFAGLSKIPALKDIFSSVNVTHSYRSMFNINNYTNSLQYTENLSLDNDIIDYPLASIVNDSGRYVPVYIISQATIAEQFAPLLGINVRTKNNLTARVDYKQDRSLSLNLNNAQVTETTNNDFAVDIGFTKDNLRLPFKSKGRVITVKNEVTFRMNMSIRDSKTVQRKTNGENTVTNGSQNFQIRPSVGYKLNRQLDITMYFERSNTNPRVGSFRRATTQFGAQVRFNLAQ
jgi:cell surface protein SprA